MYLLNLDLNNINNSIHRNMNSVRILLLLCGMVKYSQEWSYSDESGWPEKYCKKGIAQSPIDLIDDENSMAVSGPKISFQNLDKVHDVNMTNDGHVVKICFDNGIMVSGGRLPGIYQLGHINFHWNSGHLLHGKRKALEVTFTWCNTLFKNCDEAERFQNGQSLMSSLYEFQEQDNEILDPVIQSLDEIAEVNKTSKFKLNPRSLLPNNLNKFYRYWGSLTRPDCIQGKPWTIFEELCKVSQNQVSQFMKLKGENGEVLKKSYRSTQNLNNRTIYKMSMS